MNRQRSGNNTSRSGVSLSQSTRHRLILAARKQTGEHLNRLVAKFFEHLDEAFFEPAGALSSDLMQSGFIYSIRELKQLRESVSNAFVGQVQKNLDRFFAAEPVAISKKADIFHRLDKKSGSLALMNHTELEEDLAVLTVIAKGEQRYQNALQALNVLWASFTGGEVTTNSKNPVGPCSLANQFRVALAIWQGDHIVKPVVYDVFYEYVIAHLGELYQGLIDDMRGAGVKPVDSLSRIKSRSSNKHDFPRPETSETHPADPFAAPSADLQETSLLELVTLVTELFESQKKTSLGLSAAERASAEHLVPMLPESLVDVLSHLQQQFADESVFDLQTAIVSNGEFKRALQRQLGKLEQQQHQQVQVLDQHILDVVMMLFDFVLEDPVMPSPMKVVIARLQIPILQVAIHDRVFLSDRSHPARNLLNNLSRAAVRWVDDGDYTGSSLYGMIEQSVNRIVASQTQDTALYAEVDEDFSDYLHREEQAAKKAEERLNQLARGQEQLAAAREKVSRELDRLMNDQMPVAVYRILNDVWRDVLTLAVLREGKDSLSWSRMLNVAERLVDSVTLRSDEWERQKVNRDIPLLLADLREGFFSISYDANKTASMFKQLQLCHISVFRGVSPQMQPVSWKHDQHAAKEHSSDGKLQTTETLKIGQWLSWVEQDGREKRAKLSWRSEIADLLLFVDCRGRKVIEMTSDDLNNLFQDAQARVIQEIDEPIMDRVMRVVYDMLRQTASERSSSTPT